jgi:hypothetical protein
VTEWGWTPEKCGNCPFKPCTRCVHLRGVDYDVYSLFLYTVIPDLWLAFSIGIAISPLHDGGYSLSGLMNYLEGLEEIPCSHGEFWEAMMIFLSAKNSELYRRRKQKG